MRMIELMIENMRHAHLSFSRFTQLIIVGVVICIIGIYLIAVIPSYINLPIHSPDYELYGDIGDWKSITLSIYKYPIFPSVMTRVYILRKESIILDNNTSWDKLAAYFDNHLDEFGWVRSDAFAECKLYMPKANFLAKGEYGIVNYRRKNYQPMIDYDESDVVCLAIWKQMDHFNIVFLTAKPSLLKLLSDVFS